MGRKVAVEDLVGAGELAELFGLAHVQSLHTLRRRHPSFPAPVTTMKGGAMVWVLPEVKAWAIANGRLEKR